MNESQLADKAGRYLQTLCAVRPNRRTGSEGNREATAFFASTVEPLGYQVETDSFACLDYIRGEARLTSGGREFDVHISPYSLPCVIHAPVVAVSNVPFPSD